jgi:hypothetical protein
MIIIIQPGLIPIIQTGKLAVEKLIFSQEVPEYPESSKMGIGYIVNISGLETNNTNIAKLYENVKLYFSYIQVKACF